MPLHLSGGTRGRSAGGGPVLGGDFRAHLLPGAYLLKTLGQGVCAWCGLILTGELMVQFSLRPRRQLGPLPLNIGLCPLHHLFVRCCLGRGKERERRRKGSQYCLDFIIEYVVVVCA